LPPPAAVIGRRERIKKTCACGCGKEVSPKRNYYRGHKPAGNRAAKARPLFPRKKTSEGLAEELVLLRDTLLERVRAIETVQGLLDGDPLALVAQEGGKGRKKNRGTQP
jgi:hypothetical protein